MRLLLLSNSTLKGEAYLHWPKNYLKEFIEGITEVLFVPYAGVTITYDEYTEAVKQSFGSGIHVLGIHTIEDKIEAIKNAQCIVVGGGNTFHLLARMQANKLIKPIADVVRAGTPYIGWSAGSNVACPTIMTTNDMPIIQPASFSGLDLTPFQINAHYTEKLIEGHGGESRKQRLDEFLQVNKQTLIIGLPEGKLLEFAGGRWFLKGVESEPTYLFRHNQKAMEVQEGELTI